MHNWLHQEWAQFSADLVTEVIDILFHENLQVILDIDILFVQQILNTVILYNCNQIEDKCICNSASQNC